MKEEETRRRREWDVVVKQTNQSSNRSCSHVSVGEKRKQKTTLKWKQSEAKRKKKLTKNRH